MTTDNAVRQPLFRQGGGTGGEKYEYVNDGFYVGELSHFEEGPVFTNEDGTPAPKVRWIWNLFQADGVTPVMHEGNVVQIGEITSDKTGERSTAAKWFSAHLKRNFNSRVDIVEQVMLDCEGCKVNLVISTKPSGYKKIDVFPAS